MTFLRFTLLSCLLLASPLTGAQTTTATPDSVQTFDQLIEQSFTELQAKTAVHQGWGLGTEESWEFDQESGEIRFLFPDRIASAPAQIVGTYNADSGDWMWAWANTSIDPSLTADAVVVREYGESHDIDWLVAPKWSGSEMEAWEAAALSAKLNESQGVYRGPAGSTYVFIAFGSVNVQAR